MANEAEEDRILRVWTPLLLRTILIVSAVILIFGLYLTAVYAPGYYVERYRAVAAGHFFPPETFHQIISRALAGEPHSVMTLGLLVLTLVPLGRVAFCFLFFIKERDYPFVGFTGYVLLGLIAGVLLGRIG